MTFLPLSTRSGVVEYAEWLPDGLAVATVLLVHGGGVGPGGWVEAAGRRAGWAPRLAEEGFRAVVMTWPGLSADGVWDADAQPDGDDVAAAILDVIRAVGGPVVLVVHSMSAAFGYRIAPKESQFCRDRIPRCPETISWRPRSGTTVVSRGPRRTVGSPKTACSAWFVNDRQSLEQLTLLLQKPEVMSSPATDGSIATGRPPEGAGERASRRERAADDVVQLERRVRPVARFVTACSPRWRLSDETLFPGRRSLVRSAFQR